ncbi:MAG: hypothetical protein JWQ98_1193 [Chlorobi bacterium]|nr:hypothetical protein [Chlorobiota bacterium]
MSFLFGCVGEGFPGRRSAIIQKLLDPFGWNCALTGSCLSEMFVEVIHDIAR